MSIEIGKQAPDFEAKDQNGNTIKLSDYRGKKVILYFYPKDQTPGCTAQACNLRDNYDTLQQEGYEVLGISTDNEKSHQRFIEKQELPFSLIADEDKKVHELYGTWVEKSMYGRTYMGTARTTFIIDEEGNVANIIDKVKTKEHTNQILN
jgi:thioredoxin-dependent peroxiredoxin